jgi:hypothetical protein
MNHHAPDTKKKKGIHKRAKPDERHDNFTILAHVSTAHYEYQTDNSPPTPRSLALQF